MAGSTAKKVLIRRFDRESLAGFVSPQSYLQPSGVEFLTQGGAVVIVPYPEVKAVCFVRDFDTAALPSERKVFHTRPKMEGLWIRMTFRDGEVTEGILPNNLLQLDAHGFTVIPPDPYSNNQRIFLPRAALTELHVLAVVGSPLRRRKAKAPAKEQIELFEK